MKKLLSAILVLILSLGITSTLVACDSSEEPSGPQYSEEYVYDETHHWKPQINGEGDPIEYGEHVNPKTGIGVGRCKCGYYFPCHNLVYELQQKLVLCKKAALRAAFFTLQDQLDLVELLS